MAKKTITKSTKLEQSIKWEIEWEPGENVVAKLQSLGMKQLPAIIDAAAGQGHDYKLATAEQAAVLCALKASGGNIAATARMLGTTRRTVYDKMKKFKIEIKKNATIGQCDNSDI